jgi:hypothetical protein
MPRKSSVAGVPGLEVRALTAGPRHHFFGYYDKRPWNARGTRILAHEVAIYDRPPQSDDEALVGIIDVGDQHRFEPIGRTRAWNFQQGAMLQWLGPDFERHAVFNRRDDDALVGIVINLETGAERRLDRPIAALSPDGRWALSLNFARLADVRPGYGYAGLTDPWHREPCPIDDGIYLIDVVSGRSRLILSLDQITRHDAPSAPPNVKQWVNALLFNHRSNRFCFVHRWRRTDGGFVSRLLTANRDGTGLYCLSNSGMISHYDWRNANQLLAWARKGTTAARTGDDALGRLPSLGKHRLLQRPPGSWLLRLARRSGAVGWTRRHVLGDRFILFTDQTRVTENVGLGVLVEDGHCSYSPDGRWVLMDTYPHEDNQRTLLVYDTRQSKVHVVGRFYSDPRLVDQLRCDLHARWSGDGRSVCFDSTHDGSRQIYSVDVTPIVRG